MGKDLAVESLLIVSNRLPVTIRRRAGRMLFEPSVGGVARGLERLHDDLGATWVGWPGDVPERDWREVGRALRERFACRPVFLPRHIARRYYSGFSNGTLWPILHSFTAHARYSASDWLAYEEVNRRFAKTATPLLSADEAVWVHDYHLMRLPLRLREMDPEVRIGFFLHVPFPPYETLRMLPWHREILASLLASDLIGFHTYDYARAFLEAVRRVFGLDNELGRITVERRLVQVDVFPMGIDFAEFARAAAEPRTKERAAKFRRRFGSQRIVLSISRLDYTKGIPQQLAGIERFMEKNRESRGRFAYILVVVPSREIVDQYARLRAETDALVGHINSRYGSLEWVPIRYAYRYLPAEELIMLYRAADIALIAPLRDGMNLIAKEYVATRTDGRGVLILSEMAGSSQELLEALRVNPNNPDEIADALSQALAMAAEEQIARNTAMQKRLAAHDLRWWAGTFLTRLDEAPSLSKAVSASLLSDRDRAEIRGTHASAHRRLLLLDYDGTLVPLVDDPIQASPTDRVLRILESFAAAPDTEVVLISGRRKEELKTWFGGLRLTLVAEHGAWFRGPGESTWNSLVEREETWKPQVRRILERFADRVPGSFVEEKDFSLAWHYRRADPGAGFEAAKELIDTLTALTANIDLRVVPGHRVVEVQAGGIGKGKVYTARLASRPWDFVLAAGDDRTDEDLFRALPQDAFTVRVGIGGSSARYRVAAPEDVLSLLETLTTSRGVRLSTSR